MNKITVLILLSKYMEWVENDEIGFITSTNDKKQTLKLVADLLDIFKKAEKKRVESGSKKDISEILDWNDTHKKCTRMWQHLNSCALKFIDPEAKGNSRLFDFLEAATDFEDLLYGLEPYYRDHTLHSVWVYLIGEHILRDYPKLKIKDNLNWYLFNDIDRERDNYNYPSNLVEYAKKKEKKLIEDAQKRRDAVWCVIALCHDLGYSLAKLAKLNKKVTRVLEFFDVTNTMQAGYLLDIEHQYLVSQFLELMAMDVRIVPSENYKNEKPEKLNEKALDEIVLIKCYRDDSTYWRLCRALERKQHGILSSYLLFKTLGIFADASVRGPAENWGLDDDEALDNILRGDILFAIAQHEFDYAHLNEFSSLADLLVISDELEEFSRYGRQLLSRKYHDTMAEASIDFKKASGGKGEEINIMIEYKVIKLHDLNNFFRRKVSRLCKIYSLEHERYDKKHLGIKGITMTAKRGKRKLSFSLSKGAGYIVTLPADYIITPPNKPKKTLKKGKYPLVISDDSINVMYKGKTYLLDKWLPDEYN